MVEQLIHLGVSPANASRFAGPLKASMALHDISAPEHCAAFLAHVIIESARLTSLEENLRYTDPARIASIFRSGFDLNGDRVVNPEEIEFARGFVLKPEKLANRAYAGRNGNGPEASGDGWRFRGRGLFQLTGRGNYSRASNGLGLGSLYIEQPDLVAEPSDAAMTAAWFWVDKGCDRMISAGDFGATVRAINGPAMLHLKERQELFSRARRVLA